MELNKETVTKKIYLDKDHPVRSDLIDLDALFVIQRLQSKGYSAYLVGGGVRDLLLGIQPKDYDIATSAKPEEIKAVFKKNCMLIGKRFRLAHVRLSKKVFEVSTFRSGSTEDDNLIVRDNDWGTEEEDARRRDFTINGLFYDPKEHAIIDYVNGLEDIDKKLLRTIGNPEKRFKQDPVRMIRLLKFVARFNLGIEKETEKALISTHQEIVKSSPDRILGEIFKMLETNSAKPFIHLFQKWNFMHVFFPYIASYLDSEHGAISYQFLEYLDEHPTDYGDKSLAFCCILYPMLEKMIEHHYTEDSPPPHLGEIFPLTQELVHESIVTTFSRFPRWLRERIAFILNCQYRFTPIDQKKRPRHYRISKHPDYQAAIRFLSFRAKNCDYCTKAYKSLLRVKNKST